MNHKEFGNAGEDRALRHLIQMGYSLRHKNFRTRKGELDLIMNDPSGTLVFIEVKSDASGRAGNPLEWVTERKMRKILKMALLYCTFHNISEETNMRFDVIGLKKDGLEWSVNHIKNAFTTDQIS